MVTFSWFRYTSAQEQRQLSYGFDAQNASMWKWTAKHGYLPYKDVFYPYGSLFYFQETSLLAQVVLLFLTSASLFVVLQGFWYLRSSLSHFILNSLTFLLFLARFMGTETWTRYGIPTASAFVFSHISSKMKNFHIFMVGVLLGLLMGMIPDQGVYVLSVYVFSVFLRWIISSNVSPKSFVSNVLLTLFPFGIGVLVGLVPFVFYLLKGNLVQGFIYNFSYLYDIGLAAKTPFIPFALSPANIFTFAILLSSLCLLSFRLIILQEKITKEMLCAANLSFLIILLEQKSILRSIDWQITGIALLLFIVVSSYLLRTVRFKKIGILVMLMFFFITMFIYPFRQVFSEQLVTHEDPAQYAHVLGFLGRRTDYNGKVFSYPSNPVFYSLTNQKPPYFFTSYETTPRTSQGKVISYLQEEDIRYILYDLRVSSVQDGVPNYIRNSEELSYILTHYQAIEKNGPFLVLNRQDNVDLGKICAVAPDVSLCTWLTQSDLGSIPLSEGRKEVHISHDSRFVTLDELNKKLATQPLDSRGAVLFFHSENSTSYGTEVMFTTTDGETGTVTFTSGERIMLHLDRIPFFYKSRNIQHIEAKGAQFYDMSLSVTFDEQVW